MTDTKLMKTNDYRLHGDTEKWSISLGGDDFVDMDERDLIRLRDMINEVLSTFKTESL